MACHNISLTEKLISSVPARGTWFVYRIIWPPTTPCRDTGSSRRRRQTHTESQGLEGDVVFFK